MTFTDREAIFMSEGTSTQGSWRDEIASLEAEIAAATPAVAPAEPATEAALSASPPSPPPAPAPLAAAPTETPAPEASDPPVAPTDAVPSTPNAAPTTPGTEPAPAIPTEPFTFTVNRRAVAVDGAVRAGDEIRIPVAAWQRYVQPNLHDAGETTRLVGQLRQQAEQARHEVTADVAATKAMAGEFQKLLGISDDVQFVEAMLGLRATYPQKLLEAERDHYRRAAERPVQDAERQRQEAEAAEMPQRIAAWVEDTVDTALKQYPEFAEDAKDPRYVTQVKRALKLAGPTLLSDQGGQITADWDRFFGVMREFATEARADRAERARIAKVDDAARKNAEEAARRAQQTKQTPPAASAAQRQARAENGQFTETPKNWRDELNAITPD